MNNCRRFGSYFDEDADCCYDRSLGCKEYWHYSCCTSDNKCGVGEGDCDNDSDCQLGLK